MNRSSPTASLRAAWKAAVFFLKVFPMLPSRPVDWVTPRPVVEAVRYPTRAGEAAGEVYRPPTPGPHRGIVVCLGVVPFGVDHPQVPVLGKALARAGFAALLYWSPAMRDFRLDPADVENIALAYDWLISRPDVDPARSGLLGTCVGGSFALMAAAEPRIRERVGFMAAYAPFSSLWTFARDIAACSRVTDGPREPWKVDPLTRKVFVHSLTALLDPAEAERLRSAFAPRQDEAGGWLPDAPPPEAAQLDSAAAPLSAGGRAVYALLSASDAGAVAAESVEAALRGLPLPLQERLTALSPLEYLPGLRAPRVILLHDRGDGLIPVGESRRLVAALSGRGGVTYTEMQFSHLDPLKGRLPLPHLVRELLKFLRAVYPVFRQSA